MPRLRKSDCSISLRRLFAGSAVLSLLLAPVAMAQEAQPAPAAAPVPANPAANAEAASKSASPPEADLTEQASEALKNMKLPPLEGWKGSLMYSLEDQRRLQNILKLYEAVKTGKIEKPQPGQATANIDADLQNLLNEKAIVKPPPPPPAPQYLSSIIYHTPEKWSIWLNDERLTSLGERPESPVIIRVEKTFVELGWPLETVQKSIPDWQMMVEEKQLDPIAKRYLAEFRVDEGTGMVIFRLRPNQTLLPADFELVEGRVTAPKGKGEKGEDAKAEDAASGTPPGAAAPVDPNAPAGQQPGAPAASEEVPPVSPEQAFTNKKQSPAAKMKEALEGVLPAIVKP